MKRKTRKEIKWWATGIFLYSIFLLVLYLVFTPNVALGIFFISGIGTLFTTVGLGSITKI